MAEVADMIVEIDRAGDREHPSLFEHNHGLEQSVLANPDLEVRRGEVLLWAIGQCVFRTEDMGFANSDPFDFVETEADLDSRMRDLDRHSEWRRIDMGILEGQFDAVDLPKEPFFLNEFEMTEFSPEEQANICRAFTRALQGGNLKR